MLRRLVRALAPVLALSPALAHADTPMRLEDAVNLALTYNERALKAPLRVEAADGQVERARAGFLPSLVAQGNGALDAHRDPTGRLISANGTLTLSQPLLNPSAYPLYAQAKHARESERWGSVEDKRQLAFDTAKAFLLALATGQVVDAAQKRLDQAKADQADTQARADAQLNSTNDVTRASLETSSAASSLATSQGNQATALLQLAFLVGQPVTGTLAPPDSTTRAAQHTAVKLDDVIKHAQARRPDIRSSTELTASLRDFADEPLYRLAPTIGAAAQVRATADVQPPARTYDESLMLTLTWTIFDGGARYGDRRQRLAQADSQALTEHQLRRSVATDVGVAIASLRAARQAYQISSDAVNAARQNTDETEILYKQGLARAIELTDANAQRFDAEVAATSAKLNMEQAYLQLRQALGFDPLGGELGPDGRSTTPAAGAAKP